MDTGERPAPAVEPAGPVWLGTLADDGTLLTRALGDNGLTLWRSGDTKEPYFTPFTAEPEDLRLTADRLTVHQADSRPAIPLDPGTWHDTLCRRWTSYTPEEPAHPPRRGSGHGLALPLTGPETGTGDGDG
ncbi:hypothetical protein [Streptomyces sp. JB150]|uniref:hypothetical protein n=1 Tax=Streptomyces sp. JB150 TaxID=2714844 RepID=UPI00140A97CC|nr:hypothetical protein [Streptomyces sp. JB150]QIJ61939.1 hypothetical protein G7Z13_07725 [Streptomyces sp. JB150]